MKHFFFLTLLIIAIVAVGWRYLPQSIREKASAFIAATLRKDSTEIKNLLRENILSQNPEKRRAVLTQELKRHVREVKKRVAMKPVAGVEKNEDGLLSILRLPSDDELQAASTQSIVDGAEQLIEALEDANDDTSIGAEIRDRVLEWVLPAKRGQVECRVAQ